jgi:hypothetical protein
MRRTGRGLAALRERYIRRAEFLCLDAEFQANVAEVKKNWQSLRPGVSPSDLRSPMDDAMRDRLRPSLGSEWPYQVAGAEISWTHAVRQMILAFFPPWNFHFATDPTSRLSPAAFLGECLTVGDPRLLIGRADEFFSPMRIQLEMDYSEYDALHILPEEWELYHPAQRWYIPVYPGMTAEDIKAAIPDIMEQINNYLAPQTVGARIEELANDGWTHRRIAETLGLDEKSVSAHLKSARAA